MRTRIIGGEPTVILCLWHLKMGVYAAGKGKMTENVKEMVAANMRNMSCFAAAHPTVTLKSGCLMADNQFASLWSSNWQMMVTDMGYIICIMVTSHNHALNDTKQQQQLLSCNLHLLLKFT